MDEEIRQRFIDKVGEKFGSDEKEDVQAYLDNCIDVLKALVETLNECNADIGDIQDVNEVKNLVEEVLESI